MAAYDLGIAVYSYESELKDMEDIPVVCDQYHWHRQLTLLALNIPQTPEKGGLFNQLF
jgi:hypothetical protein